MDTAIALAAEAAGTRAVECRSRVEQLAAGRRVADEDVRRAQTALARALNRAELARGRLEGARNRSRAGAARPSTGVHGRTQDRAAAADLERLRRRARQLDQDELFTSYFGLGGPADRWSLDAFVHAGLDLPADHVAILAQALWELTELP